MYLTNGGVAPSVQVVGLSRLWLEVDRLLEKLDGLLYPCVLLSKCLHAVVHPSHLPVDVGFELVWKVRLFQEDRVLTLCLRMSPTYFVKVGYVEPLQRRNIDMGTKTEQK